MAISYVGTGQSYATTITIPAGHAALDEMYMFAIRGAAAAPTPPAGWTLVPGTSSTAGGLGSAVFYKQAASGSETSGTWSDSIVLICNVYRGTTTPGAASTATGTGTTIGYPALTANAPTTSWFARFASHGTASNVNSATVTGYTFRSTTAPNFVSLDSNGAPGSNPTLTNQTVNVSDAWMATTVEIPLSAAASTGNFFQMF